MRYYLLQDPMNPVADPKPGDTVLVRDSQVEGVLRPELPRVARVIGRNSARELILIAFGTSTTWWVPLSLFEPTDVAEIPV